MPSWKHPEYCFNLNREQILKKLRIEKDKNYNLYKRVQKLAEGITKYASAIKITIGVRGGWWCVKNRPRGKGSGKLGGNYIRDPFNN